MSYEHAPWKKKGKYTGIVQAGFPVGLLLANLVFLLSVNLGGDSAWRVPFLASIVLVAVGLIIRSKVPESPVFEEVKSSGQIARSPIVQVSRGLAQHRARHRPAHRRDRWLCRLHHYMISYLHTNDLADKSQTLVALCVASAIGIFATMAWGALTDKIGRRPLYIVSTAFAVLFGIPMFMLVNTGVFFLDHRHGRPFLRGLPELVGRSAGCLVPRALPGQDPFLRRIPGLPDLGDGFRFHAVHHHLAIPCHRVDGTCIAL